MCVCCLGPTIRVSAFSVCKSLGKTAIVAVWSLFAVCEVSISSTGLQMPLYPFPRGKICVQISRISFLRIPPVLEMLQTHCMTRLYLPGPNKNTPKLVTTSGNLIHCTMYAVWHCQSKCHRQYKTKRNTRKATTILSALQKEDWLILMFLWDSLSSE